VTTDGGEASLVVVAERLPRLTANRTQDILRRRASFLIRGGGAAGHQGAVVPGDGGEVAGDEDLRTPRHREVGLYHHPSGTVQWRAERLPERRRGIPCRPEHRTAGDALIAHVHGVPLDTRHQRSRAHLNAELREVAARHRVFLDTSGTAR